MQAVLRQPDALRFMLDYGLLESGVRRIGAEQEIFPVDGSWRPTTDYPPPRSRRPPADAPGARAGLPIASVPAQTGTSVG